MFYHCAGGCQFLVSVANWGLNGPSRFVDGGFKMTDLEIGLSVIAGIEAVALIVAVVALIRVYYTVGKVMRDNEHFQNAMKKVDNE